jgi:IclR family acetate operon transcriptional repressor
MKTVKSVKKALDILGIFQSGGEMSVREMAEVSGINRTTVNRLAATLLKQGYLKQTKRRGKYSLGIKILDLVANIKKPETTNTTIPHILFEFSRLVNEDVFFYIWTDPLLNRGYINGGSGEGHSMDRDTAFTHNSSVGKIILANMNHDDLSVYLNRNLLSFSSKSDMDKIKKQLTTVKQKGIAFEYEESHPGVNGVAAGVRNRDGETVGAIFVSGSSERLTPIALEKIAPSIQQTALRISMELGFQE